MDNESKKMLTMKNRVFTISILCLIPYFKSMFCIIS